MRQVQGVPSYRSLADVKVAVDLAIVVVPSPAVAQALRVIGPNCLGSFALPSKAFATFSSAFDEEGALPDDAIALVSQSGAVGTFIYATMVACGVGVRYFANTGNEADVSVGELLGSLAEADDVDVLIGYLEDARRLGALEDAARRADRRGKPLLLIKSGATAEGRAAPESRAICCRRVVFPLIPSRCVRCARSSAWSISACASAALKMPARLHSSTR